MKEFENQWNNGVFDTSYETDEIFANRVWKAALEWVLKKKHLVVEVGGDFHELWDEDIKDIEKELEN